MNKAILAGLLVLILTAPLAAPAESGAEWLHIPLRDVNSGESFTLADFAGRKVLPESFAVWCPTRGLSD